METKVEITITAKTPQDALCCLGDALRRIERYGLQSASVERPDGVCAVVVEDEGNGSCEYDQ